MSKICSKWDKKCSQTKSVPNQTKNVFEKIFPNKKEITLTRLKVNSVLKHSQYKNDATHLKKFFALKLPPFFFHRVGDRKRRQFQNREPICYISNHNKVSKFYSNLLIFPKAIQPKKLL